MEELKIELDACRQRLDAKYKAVAILRQQAELTDSELKNTEQKASETSKRLEKEVSKLQFELEWKESSFMDSQQTWAQRFDGVCQENLTLMSKLEARNEELRRANAHKSAVIRERDELLALLDVTERLKYEQGKSKISEDDYGTFSSSELAVLGACKCRVTTLDPCGCAHAAANLRKEVARLREEAEIIQSRREEANLTTDAYRSAFEEQLSKTRSLSLHLAHLSTITSRSSKARAAIKFLIQVLNEDDYNPPKTSEKLDPVDVTAETLPRMNLHELVTVLTHMVNEKKEALAHQKLTIHLMASKLHVFENKYNPLSMALVPVKGVCGDSAGANAHVCPKEHASKTVHSGANVRVGIEQSSSVNEMSTSLDIGKNVGDSDTRPNGQNNDKTLPEEIESSSIDTLDDSVAMQSPGKSLVSEGKSNHMEGEYSNQGLDISDDAELNDHSNSDGATNGAGVRMTETCFNESKANVSGVQEEDTLEKADPNTSKESPVKSMEQNLNM